MSKIGTLFKISARIVYFCLVITVRDNDKIKR